MRRGVIAALTALVLLVACHVPPARAWDEYVRVTFYVLPGFMANGERVHKGAAACSRGFPMGTQLQFWDGWIVTCKDRGYLGPSTGWVDVWAPSMAWGLRYVEGDYGRYTWVSVLRWGY